MDAELDDFVARIKAVYAPFKADSNLNEPVTERGPTRHASRTGADRDEKLPVSRP